MSQPLITYNDGKIKELQTEIDNIPGAIPYDDQTKEITLNGSDVNHGQAETFSRGDHTHWLNLSDVTVDLKTPLKIIDEERKIKKVIIQQTTHFKPTGEKIHYFKFPIVPVPPVVNYTHVEFNFTIVYYEGSLTQHSSFKILIKQTINLDLVVNIDNSLNNGKYNITSCSVVYYDDDEGIRNYYLKLIFTTGSMYEDVTYSDLSVGTYIPDDFTYTDMFLTTLPKTETVFSSTMFNITNVFLSNVAKNNGTANIYVLTSSGTNNPSVTHPAIYGGSQVTWSGGTEIVSGSGIYAWKAS